ncbi:flagellar basal body rod protein [Oceanobacillus piezotolerans]|uniref:Flagellar basal body rod protein n=1 Tax=Oceanobacillus piezotolerans TaxID=2448030 RepID=A0A498D7Q5_9BACI|nr:flagellar basal body rod protein [Oceanobacillus piezotolerans]RLL46556.1 flagellar basal body rod protein [Oceanobacillus piezotolerans]
MRKFMLFVGGLIALVILLANIGPMVLLGLGIWLLYFIFKQFVKSNSTAGKIGWVILGLLTSSLVISNIWAVIGLLAAVALYYIYKSWKKEDDPVVQTIVEEDDPFTNFERQWAEMKNY